MKYDIIVAGAGAAGSLAALIGANRGFNVCLVEKNPLGSYVPCSGVFPKHHAIDFPEVPESIYERDLLTTKYMAPVNHGVLDAREFNTTLGKVIYRSKFDSTIATMAMDAGATVLDRTMVKDIRVRQDGVVARIAPARGTDTTSKSSDVHGSPGNHDNQEIMADVLCLATGTSGFFLHDKLGLEKPPVVHAVIGEFRSSEEHVENVLTSGAYHFYLNRKISRIGPFWITCRRDGYFNAGIIDYKVSRERLENSIAKDPHLHPLFKDASPAPIPGKKDHVAFATIPAAPIEHPFADRVLVLGDAAGLVQQFYYEGIWEARYSAKHAIDVITKLHESGKPFTRENLDAYKHLAWRTIVNAFLRSGRRNSYMFWKARNDMDLWEQFCKSIATNRKYRKLIVECFGADYSIKDWDTEAGEILYMDIPFLKKVAYLPYFLKAASIR